MKIDPFPPPAPARIAPAETAAPGGGACDRPRAGIAAELRKRCPFECPEEEAYLNLVRTADRLSRAFDRLLKSRGLSQPLYNCLRILVGAESTAAACDRTEFHGLPISEMGDRLVAHAPDVTRLADRLEKLGLAERRRCAADRRSVRLFPTGKARAAVAELAGPVRDLHRTQLGHLGDDRLAVLSALLVDARRTAGEVCPPASLPE